MPSGESSRLVSGALSTDASGGLEPAGKTPKVNKGRGLLCWAIFGAFLVFFIIMTAVYTDPKGYKKASQVSYLAGEDAVLFKGLGPVYFVPATKKLNALANFQLGLQLLHVFWYDLAIQKFQEAQQQDPKLAMAYWGEAMCYKQPLWQTENITAAQEVLAKMDDAIIFSTLGEREKAYVSAVKVLYAANTSLATREMQYALAMQMVSSTFQDDPDAYAFAALANLGIQQSVGNYVTPEQASMYRNTAEELLGDGIYYYPDHVGLLHYMTALNDVDNAEQAASGLSSALALAKVATVSSRAQHMPSHFYLRIGNWSQVVTSNMAAVTASDNYCKAVEAGDACDADNRYHALEWQLYGHTQQCAFMKANVAYKRMQVVAAASKYGGDYGQWVYRMYAHMQLQSMNTMGAIPLRNATDNATSFIPPALYDTASIQAASDIGDHFWPPHAEAHALLARIYSLVFSRTAAQQQQPVVQATVSAALSRLDAIVVRQNNLTAAAAASNSTSAAAIASSSEMATLLTTVQLQAHALVHASMCASGANASACDLWRPLMDTASSLYSNITGSVTLPSLKIAPTPEFYGNLLLAVNGSDSATAAAASTLFSTCLTQLPGRMPCVLGMARAARATGDSLGAKAWYAKIVAQCGTAGDAKFAPLVEARAATASSPPPPEKSGRRGLA